MGMDISTSLDALTDVLQKKLYNSGDAVPEYMGGSDIASKVMYITALFNIIYSEEEETGGGSTGGVMVVHATSSQDMQFTLNKTWQEIYDAIDGGQIVVIQRKDLDEIYCEMVNGVYIDKGTAGKFVYCCSVENKINTVYSAETADGYPTYGLNT